MKTRAAMMSVVLSMSFVQLLKAQEKEPGAARSVTLEEAVQLALKHNHVVRIATFKVEEKQHAKDAARSGYFPSLRNESSVARISDLQHIELAAGSLGSLGASQIPPVSVVLNQGGRTFETSGTSLTEPLTQLLKVKEVNDIARAEWNASRADAQQAGNEVALRVHQLYYKVLIAQLHRRAVEAEIGASEELRKERTEQQKLGSALEQEVLETRAQMLQARQDMLSTDLLLSDLNLQLNDAMGLPLTTRLTLSPSVPENKEVCALEECVRLAVQSHPEIEKSRQQVEEASAAVRLAKRDFLPDTAVFARYSYQNDLPFLVHNFGTFGFLLSYDIFDGGRKRATLGIHKSQVDQAKENLARVTEEVELRVQTAYNKLVRTREMVKVSEELLALRTESGRELAMQVKAGSALQSQEDAAAAHELEAKAGLLQAQLDFVQARDEVIEAVGQTPE